MADETAPDLALLLEEVRLIEAQSKQLVSGVMAGGYCSVFRGPGIEFDEIREYVEGDDPRTVDWNVTARVGRPFVKEYVEERERTLLFAFDLSASMSAGFGALSVRQWAARVCACLALSANQNDDKVGLIAFSHEVDAFVPPRKGVRHVLRIVRDCLALPAGSAATSYTAALEFAARVVRRRSILFLVSDFLSDGWQATLPLCARRHDTVAVRMLAPELTPSDGLMRIRDPETGRTRLVDWSDGRTRQAYRERVDRWRSQTARDLLRASADVLDVPLPHDYDTQAIARPILKFFQMRERRGAKR